MAEGESAYPEEDDRDPDCIESESENDEEEEEVEEEVEEEEEDHDDDDDDEDDDDEGDRDRLLRRLLRSRLGERFLRDLHGTAPRVSITCLSRDSSVRTRTSSPGVNEDTRVLGTGRGGAGEGDTGAVDRLAYQGVSLMKPCAS